MFSVIYYFSVTAISVFLVLMLLPSIIHVARENHLFDDHSLSRKEHGYGIPRLGGIAFCLSIILTSFIIAKNGTNLPMYDLYAATIVLFVMGVKDDLSGVHRHTKLLVQTVVAFIITVPGDIRLNNLYGILNLHELNYVPSVLVSMFIIIFIINSFNLIDGIDGLAGTLGVIACCTFAYCFLEIGETALTALALSAAGSLIAFLAYNYSPAKIFMGDAGSLFLGMLCAIFAIKFIALNEVSANLNLQDAPAFAFAVLIIPAFDTCSVVFTRILHKKSPLKPDRNHIHHRMLRLGLTHMQTTAILCLVNVLFICLAVLFKHADNQLMLLLFALILTVLNGVVNQLLRVKAKQVFPVGSLIR